MSTAPRLTINLNNLASNWQFMAEHSGAAQTSAVIKANGYGLGIDIVAKTLSEAGCDTFFTAMMEEAETVRSVVPEARIFVLNGIVDETIETAKQINAIPVLSSMYQIEMWSKQSDGQPSAIHVDTGMNRLGLSLEEAQSLADDRDMLGSINPQLLMSHLACGDEPRDPKNTEQLENFKIASSYFPDINKSFANSAGIMLGDEYHYDLTRPGISLYGAEAVNDVPVPTKPVVISEARILQIREAKSGDTVGYGGAHTLTRDSKIAICSGGYADGLQRSYSGSGVSLRAANPIGGIGAIEDHRVAHLGRVSMDLSAFDVTDVPEPVLENAKWVELFGKTIPIDEAARACGTIGYELLTSLGGRYKREFVQ